MTMLNFADYKWETSFSWRPVLDSDELPYSDEYANSALCHVGDTQLAIFRSTENRLFALQNLCGHRVAFVLSEGTLGFDKITDSTYVMCPLHRRKFFLDGDLKGRTKSGMKKGHSIATFAAKEEDGRIWVELPDAAELDSVLGTHRWLPARPDASRPKASKFGFAPTSRFPVPVNNMESRAASCATTCSLTEAGPDEEAPLESAEGVVPACHKRGMSDTESDSSVAKSPPKDQQDPESEPPVCPVAKAKAQALCW